MKLAEPLNQARKTPRLFLKVASLLYISTLVAGIYYSFVIPVALWRFSLFIGLLLILLALEQVEQRFFATSLTIPIAISFLLARMGLLEAVAAVDNSGLSRVLYPLIPFAAYFSLG